MFVTEDLFMPPHPAHRLSAGALLLAVASVLLARPTPADAQGVGMPTVSSSNVGYIDPAALATMFRLRFDAAYDNNRPNRAEFFYPQGGFPGSPGPPLPETRVDYQEASGYLEGLLAPRLSAFIEAPVRFFNGEVNANAAGLSDINAGFKFALRSDDDGLLTFQFRTYVPTGDADRGLGTNHVSLEPGLLFLHRLSDRLNLEGEFRAWVPVGGTSFAGNVLRYGTGLSYRWQCTEDVSLSPVAEVVGWTVLNGRESSVSPTGTVIESAAGDTIVNTKLGLRLGLGDVASLYAGYGRPLTGEVWYKDIWRFELRLTY
jgi:hypothetical protein